MQNVEQLHFLIHPGWGSDPDTSDVIYRNDAEWEEGKKGAEELYAPLLQAYIDRSKCLTKQGLLAVFLHAKPEELRQDFARRKLYTAVIQQLRGILGRRMIVLSDKHEIFEGFSKNGLKDVTDTIDVLRRISAKRGFIFTDATPTIAYGETLTCCLADGANALNAAGRFLEETVVEARLSDRFSSTREQMQKEINDFITPETHDCIIITLDE